MDGDGSIQEFLGNPKNKSSVTRGLKDVSNSKGLDLAGGIRSLLLEARRIRIFPDRYENFYEGGFTLTKIGCLIRSMIPIQLISFIHPEAA